MKDEEDAKDQNIFEKKENSKKEIENFVNEDIGKNEQISKLKSLFENPLQTDNQKSSL